MPTIEIDGFRFRFYSSDLGEPPHFHVLRGDAEAKVWLEPVRLAHSHGYNERDVLRILRLAVEHRQRLLEVWNEYFRR